MAKRSTIGHGYGSEWHLLRFLGRHRERFNEKLVREIGVGSAIEWLDFRFRKDPSDRADRDEEIRGLDFLEESLRDGWDWPKSGTPPTWDVVGRLKNGNTAEWLLVEAKADTDEIKSNCAAKGQSLLTIANILEKTKRRIGVASANPWTKEYYQLANRIAVLHFLNVERKIPARLVLVYFIGDEKKCRPCPQNETQWKSALDAQDSYLGLKKGHALSDRVHKIFLHVNGDHPVRNRRAIQTLSR